MYCILREIQNQEKAQVWMLDCCPPPIPWSPGWGLSFRRSWRGWVGRLHQATRV